MITPVYRRRLFEKTSAHLLSHSPFFHSAHKVDEKIRI